MGEIGKNVCIVTPPNFQAIQFSQALENETDFKCFYCSYLGFDEINSLTQDCLNLVLIDSKNPFCPYFKSDFSCCCSKPCRLPKSSIFAFFNFDPESNLERWNLAQGLKGIFYENELPDNICKGIRALLNGETWFPRKVLTQWALKSDLAPASKNNLHLTQREIEVLLEISLGNGNEEIADNLGVSVHTVKTHSNHLFRKIGVSNRLQAGLWAMENL